jgi:hypothetical protein
MFNEAGKCGVKSGGLPASASRDLPDAAKETEN